MQRTLKIAAVGVQPSPKKTTKAPPLLIDVTEAARLTGLSPRTVWRFVASSRFPAPLRLGGRRLWNQQELIEWVSSGCPQVEPDHG